MKKTKVITIAAVSGGGKTTVTKELTNKLNSSKAIYFDDYDFEEYPEDFYEWVKSGADYNAWNLKLLENDINDLLISNKFDYLLIDYPFAYKNDMVAPYIDYTIYIDTPLDIAMARRILRDFIDQPDVIKDDLSNYLLYGRSAYIEMIKSIKPNSDLVIDGSLDIDNIVLKILDKLSAIKSK